MKLLDRYVLTTFLKNYAISLAVLIGLFVAMDMVFHFDDFVSVDSARGNMGLGALGVMRDVANYYFYQSFLIFVQLSGVIPVVAAAFTLMRLSRFNELTAFLAAGVPLLRVSVPIICASVLLNGLLILDQEKILPNMIPEVTRKQKEMHSAAVSWFPIKSMQVDQHSLLLAARYYPTDKTQPAHMDEVDVVTRNDAVEPVSHLIADAASWDGHHWVLTNGRIVTGLKPGAPLSPEMPVADFRGDVTPEEIALYHSSSFVDLLSTKRINELLAHPKSYGAAGLYKVKHLRATQPFMNVILLLLAIPMVLTHDPKTLKTGATKCLLLIGAAMGSVFLAQQMAGNPPAGIAWLSGWAALMAWVPIFIFGPLAAWLMDRVRT
jgi:lipopolysaccharide export system permease protein